MLNLNLALYYFYNMRSH